MRYQVILPDEFWVAVQEAMDAPDPEASLLAWSRAYAAIGWKASPDSDGALLIESDE